MSRARATPLHAARRAAAKELALPITDWRVIRLATLVCAHDAVQARLANGASVDVDHLLKLDAALVQARAAAAPAPPVSLQICRQLHGVCQRCGHIQELDEELPPTGVRPVAAGEHGADHTAEIFRTAQHLRNANGHAAP